MLLSQPTSLSWRYLPQSSACPRHLPFWFGRANKAGKSRRFPLGQGDTLQRALGYRTTNQRVRLLLLQPVDIPSTGRVGRVSPPCVRF
jgi:hypothetical protein